MAKVSPIELRPATFGRMTSPVGSPSTSARRLERPSAAATVSGVTPAGLCGAS